MEKRSAPPDLRAGLMQCMRLVQALWLISLAVVAAAWVILPLIASQPSGFGWAGNTLAVVFYGVGLVDIAAGWWLKERVFAAAQAAAAQSSPLAMSRLAGGSVVAVTLAQTPAILGAVLYLGWGNRAGLSVLCVLSLIGLALHRPRLDRWQEIVIGAGGHAHRPA